VSSNSACRHSLAAKEGRLTGLAFFWMLLIRSVAYIGRLLSRHGAHDAHAELVLIPHRTAPHQPTSLQTFPMMIPRLWVCVGNFSKSHLLFAEKSCLGLVVFASLIDPIAISG